VSLSDYPRKSETLIGVFLAILALDLVLQRTNSAPGFAALLTIALIVIGAALCLQVIRQSIWRLRNRLIVTYVFMALVPIALTLALAAIGTWIVAGQVAVYLVHSELDRRAVSLENPVRFLSRATPAERSALLERLGSLVGSQFPGYEILVSGDQTLRYPPDSKLEPPPPELSSYTGYVAKEGTYYCLSAAQSGQNRAVILAPVTSEFLASLMPGIGLLSLAESSGLNHRYIAGGIPPAYDVFDRVITWAGRMTFPLWEKPDEKSTVLLGVRTRPSAVLSAVFGNQAEDGQNFLVAFAVVASLLLLVEMLSLVTGVSLARTITSAVDGLYEGTARIAKGDFAHRIPARGKDQLAELGRSFNNMTAQLETLLVVAREKERLQSEVEIAGEVQNQLFPRAAPPSRTLDLIGVCHPARMVSGDYYDYLSLPDGNLALAIGDVAGKGISAALLMASIQSIMRTQLAAGIPLLAAAGSGRSATRFSTADVVARLNHQLYASTAPEKYSTLFFGVYDEDTRTLTYTNAGHVPPLLLHRGEAIPLEVTGTVVGAFPSIHYEEQTVRIDPDDLLVAYTDGITEPENAWGEEFGVARLAELLVRHQTSEPAEIVAKMMEAAAHWSNAAEQADDMTIMIARGRP
jgi:sigma-B regulation protein RsbU (phosphoserine phosphatase)